VPSSLSSASPLLEPASSSSGRKDDVCHCRNATLPIDLPTASRHIYTHGHDHHYGRTKHSHSFDDGSIMDTSTIVPVISSTPGSLSYIPQRAVNLVSSSESDSESSELQ
jgi:hypothetical protein